jgi:hypothetical protein
MIKAAKALSVLVALASLYGLVSAQLPQREVWMTRDNSPQEIARFRVEVAATPEALSRGLYVKACSCERRILCCQPGCVTIANTCQKSVEGKRNARYLRSHKIHGRNQQSSHPGGEL